MVENNSIGLPDTSGDGVGAKGFLHDLVAGFFMGVAFIIPGFSGGSVAAILGIYERMISAVANVFKEFKKSIITLLPIGIGLVVGAASLLFPLGYMLQRFPLPTVSLFVGLAIGGIPSMWGRVKGKTDVKGALALSVPLVLALLICFIPAGAEVDLFNIGFGGYVLLFLIGVLGSSALVVPGISGSMLLLILGYYRPLLALVSDHLFKFRDVGHSVLVLGVCGVGIAVGFLAISVIMKQLLAKYPRGTFYAIVGFIIGSLPAVYVSTMKDAGMLTDRFSFVGMPTSPVHYIACAVLLAIGICLSLGMVHLAKKKAE